MTRIRVRLGTTPAYSKKSEEGGFKQYAYEYGKRVWPAFALDMPLFVDCAGADDQHFIDAVEIHCRFHFHTFQQKIHGSVNRGNFPNQYSARVKANAGSNQFIANHNIGVRIKKITGQFMGDTA
jgi:hypothetical protein